MAETIDIAGQRCLVWGAGDALVADAKGVRALIEAALGEAATVVAVPVKRLDAAFFDLRTGLAGEVLQKFANYRLTLAVIGDVSGYVSASGAFRDLVAEAGRGAGVLFIEDLAAVEARLAAG